ncbi:hypothetical protein H6G76_03120 [Nostoc sp. FACHB-152]|uniref:hypothetical protein n=1 Tax=unclassified Nostoc TaxID=2593658 RepID=UPI001682D3B4|nr:MULTISPECIES: hypothetical protein [unclassified Nostoc]MBD2446163.1 hypothetical protein [Nostoc sp. FACHB-152]MBD2467395.1 hypothetical protein [Nostoc sp. FACHB-145]
MSNYRFLQTITSAIIIATLALSCDTTVTRKTEESRAKATAQQKSQPKIAYGELIIKEQSDYLMIPVNAIEQNKEKESGFSIASRSYEKDNGILYNIVFYRKQDGETHLLLNKKAIIDSFDFLESKIAGKPSIKFWLYKIIDQDTNQDKTLNTDDAIIGYISDLSGKNFQQITPNKSKVINWVVLPSQNAIFIKILKDSNNDNKFTSEDQTNFVRVSLEKPSVGSEIISENLEKEIKSYVQQ